MQSLWITLVSWSSVEATKALLSPPGNIALSPEDLKGGKQQKQKQSAKYEKHVNRFQTDLQSEEDVIRMNSDDLAALPRGEK